MTAAVPYQAMIAITANTATGITARSAAAIARGAIRQCVWGVLMGVPHAMSRSVVTVLPNARIAKRRSVRIA